MNKPILAIVLAILAVAAVVAGVYVFNRTSTAGQSINTLPDYPVVEAQIGGSSYKLLVPQTPDERAVGLAAVPRLPEGWGMKFPGRGQIGIWMKDMQYAIDIIWLDNGGQVIHIEQAVRPDSYPQVYENPDSTDARWVIEINSGEVDRVNLGMGDKIIFIAR